MIAAADAPGDTNVRQVVTIARRSPGDVRVYVRRYEPYVQDSSLEDELDKRFDDIDAALDWLESIGMPWSLLHEPRAPTQSRPEP